MRELFDLELRYSFVYCMSQSAKSPELTDYARLFIFEHAIAYLDHIYEIAHGGRNTGLYSYHDALRVLFHGKPICCSPKWRRRPHSLRHHAAATALFDGHASTTAASDGRHGFDNLERSLGCLERTASIVGQIRRAVG